MTSVPTKKQSSERHHWGTAALIAENLWRIRLCNPRSTLLINTYVYAHKGYVAVFDPGWPWTVDALQDALSSLNIAENLDQVNLWLYTHTHIDHMGAAVLLQQRSSAPHVVWPWIEHELNRWHTFQDLTNDWDPWRMIAFPEPVQQEILAKIQSKTSNQPKQTMISAFGEGHLENIQRVEIGQTIEVGDLRLQAIDARGHDPFHIAFWEPQRRWLFSGDVVLATPTPISRVMHDNLVLYEQSLHRLQSLDAALLLPGHGMHHTEDIHRSFSRSLGYVSHYRQKTLDILKESPRTPLDLYSIGLLMTPDNQPYTPDARWWVHLALIDSHLHDFVRKDIVERIPGPYYVLK